jgi:hypothetical protein
LIAQTVASEKINVASAPANERKGEDAINTKTSPLNKNQLNYSRYEKNII